MEGRCRGFPFVCEHIFQTHCSCEIIESFSKDLLELGTGGYKFKTSRKDFKLVIRERFIGEIFNIFLVLNSSVIG